MHDVIVVGLGAAGMMAAITAAENGMRVLAVEKNEKPGKKVYITGKGRCNVTNDCTQDEFLREVPRNPRFLYSAISRFTPQDMLALLEESGCPVVVQRGRRAYPASEKASDVTRALMNRLLKADAQWHYQETVTGLVIEDGVCRGVKTDRGEYRANSVIVTCGGLSAPGTGSTGDGYALAREAGHTVMPLSPVLVGVETKEPWSRTLPGLSLKNVTLTMKKGKKTLYSELGEMLFTHWGISGPLVLTMSCHMPEQLTDAAIELDLKPGLDAAQLDARLQRDIAAQPKKTLRNLLIGLMPSSLAQVFPAICGLDGSMPAAQMNRAQREKLVQTMQHLPLTAAALRPIEEAVVTRGGVSVKEINPGTMESKLVPGLYFAGEVIDVDAHTGGYNLQIAWSTGRLAGLSAAGL